MCQVFVIGSGAHASLSDLTIAGGKSNFYSGFENGGGIHNGGTLYLTNCTLSGNSSASTGGPGGGIDNEGIATLANCTLSGNSAYEGGGIFNNGSLAVSGCTLSGNSGGGILNGRGTLYLTNCTLSGNSAGVGGGIFNSSGIATLDNCTLSGNSAVSYGGGIYNGGTVILNNCIVANSPQGGDIVNDGTLRGSNNLIETPVTGSGTNSLPGWLSGDPRLGPLQDNGGPTWTQALLPGSAAIDAGDNSLVPTGVSTDQRGRDRFGNGITDLGAFEFWPGTPTDNTAPVTTAVSSGQAYADQHAGWNNTDVTVTLSATDAGGSGLARTEYTTDGSHWTPYTAPFTLSQEGTYSIGYRSVDNAGNIEQTHSLAVKIDKTAPVTTAVSSGQAGPTVSVSLSAADKLSGLGATYYTVDGGPQHKYAGAFVIAADGIHIVNYWSSDNAGNVEQRRSLQIQINQATTGTVIGSGSTIYRRFFNIRVHSQMVAGLPVLSGHLSFFDIQTGIYLASTSITYLRVQPDGMHATICGTATVNGFSGFIFTVFVKGNVQPGPGRYDQFRIVISRSAPPGFSYDSNLFNLATGNIQVRKN
jgi:hypothetical protein